MLSLTSFLSVLAWQLLLWWLACASVMDEEKVPSPLGIQDLVCDLLKVKSFLAYSFTCVIQELRESTLLRFTISLHRLCPPNPSSIKLHKKTTTKTCCKAKKRFFCRKPLLLNKSCCIQLASAFQASICAVVVL